jgi:hypothetical protein
VEGGTGDRQSVDFLKSWAKEKRKRRHCQREEKRKGRCFLRKVRGELIRGESTQLNTKEIIQCFFNKNSE